MKKIEKDIISSIALLFVFCFILKASKCLSADHNMVDNEHVSHENTEAISHQNLNKEHGEHKDNIELNTEESAHGTESEHGQEHGQEHGHGAGHAALSPKISIAPKIFIGFLSVLLIGQFIVYRKNKPKAHSEQNNSQNNDNHAPSH